jgi:hypothetical protein
MQMLNTSTNRRLAAGGVATLVIAGAAVGPHASRDESPNRSAPRPAATCPHGTRPLPPDALAPAVLAALDDVDRRYTGIDTDGARVVKAARATFDQDRGGYAKAKCTTRIQNRTIVVYLEFPKMRPSASLSQGVVLVSRTVKGYRVWATLH